MGVGGCERVCVTRCVDKACAWVYKDEDVLDGCV